MSLKFDLLQLLDESIPLARRISLAESARALIEFNNPNGVLGTFISHSLNLEDLNRLLQQQLERSTQQSLNIQKELEAHKAKIQELKNDLRRLQLRLNDTRRQLLCKAK